MAKGETGKPVSISTVRGYRSAIGVVHEGFPDGSKVSDNSVIRDLLRGWFHKKAVPKPLPELWDLPLVLDYLAGPPFEPMSTSSFRNLTLKTVFLLQLASARRVSWVHSCLSHPAYTRFENGGVTLVPYLRLDKNQTQSFTPNVVFIPSLKNLSPDDKVHCPVRALLHYVRRADKIRGQDKTMFLVSQEPYGPASKATVSGWVKSVIKDAYTAAKVTFPAGADARAHSTRSVASSWALASGVSVPEIMDAAGWKTNVTFASHYLKDFHLKKGKFAAGVLSAAGASVRH